MTKIGILSLLAICNSCFATLHTSSRLYTSFPNQCSIDIKMDPFEKVGEKYYLIEGNEKLSWYGAAHFCRSKDANLATIASANEMHTLSQHLVDRGFSESQWFWLSGNDLTTEGEFHWLSTGRPMTYTKWSGGQPDDNGGNEDCVHLWRQGTEFYMNDWQCIQKAHFICEANTPQTVAITFW